MIIPTRVRAAAIIPRWSIVWTHHSDNVAEHSFFVSVYADMIADLIGWDGSRSRLLTYALYHDMDELVTGDIVAPVKHNIVNPTVEREFVDAKLLDLAPHVFYRLRGGECYSRHDEVLAIVKVADRLDATLFALQEFVMGNAIIGSRILPCHTKLRQAWYSLPAHPDDLERWWLQTIDRALIDHLDPSKYDIE